MACTNRAIFIGETGKQRAERFAFLYGGIVLPARSIIKIISDDQTQDFGAGFVVVPRRPRSGMVKLRKFQAKL